MHWPMPLPPMVGYGIDHIWLRDPHNERLNPCFDNMVATAPDGHDVLTETGPNESGLWRVTSMSPPAGTLVTRDQKIVMTVVPDNNPPS
jgi:hypothetical protein